jgi:hypothetical protein
MIGTYLSWFPYRATHRALPAGRDTTASTLTWCIYLLSQHRNVLERLRAEILEKVGPMRRPDFDDLKELKYMRAVINGQCHSLENWRYLSLTAS